MMKTFRSIATLLVILVISCGVFAQTPLGPCCPGACCPNINILNTKAEVITMRHSPKLINKLVRQAKIMQVVQVRQNKIKATKV